MKSVQENDVEHGATGGRLFIVSTPIGNLKDITLRAIEILKEADLIAAEDTRHTRILLQHYDIRTPTTSYFDFNKEKKIPSLLKRLQGGGTIALVSDAGTPGISDPAYRLVRTCIDAGIEIEAIPGATAFVPALVLSGLPTDRFAFEGFLPQKKGRKTRIESLVDEKRTLIFYESPYRVARTLRELAQYLGNRPAAVVRELTKKFEQVARGTLFDLNENMSQIKMKGEFVLIVAGKQD